MSEMNDDEEIGESGGNEGHEDFRSGDQILRSLGIISPSNYGVLSDK